MLKFINLDWNQSFINLSNYLGRCAGMLPLLITAEDTAFLLGTAHDKFATQRNHFLYITFKNALSIFI